MHTNYIIYSKLCKSTGKIITIHTADSDIPSGSFSGLLLYVSPFFIRLLIYPGSAPINPQGIFPGVPNVLPPLPYTPNIVCDIPTDKIAGIQLDGILG